ncbi:hypothetical protein [Symbiopectobacterium purcellii]|uniref:hypothetical protein n=1 Tax=Symbiopectobacterium purcellii TaxID=2871826 RepID=UPI003F879743
MATIAVFQHPPGAPLAAIANRLKNDYILCPDMRQRSIAGCYQNNVAWLYDP